MNPCLHTNGADIFLISIGQPPNVRAKHKLFGCAKFGTELGWILCDNQITARLERGVGREGEIDAVGKLPPAKVFRPVTGIVQLDKLDRRRLGIGVVVNLVDDNARSNRAWPSDAKRGEKNWSGRIGIRLVTG